MRVMGGCRGAGVVALPLLAGAAPCLQSGGRTGQDGCKGSRGLKGVGDEGGLRWRGIRYRGWGTYGWGRMRVTGRRAALAFRQRFCACCLCQMGHR